MVSIIHDLNDQNLTSVPERDSRVNIQEIKHLYMDNNRLTQLEEYALTRYRKLAYLYIRKNKLINICPSAFKGALIQVLDLSQNRLSCIPNMSAIQKSLSVLIL